MLSVVPAAMSHVRGRPVPAAARGAMRAAGAPGCRTVPGSAEEKGWPNRPGRNARACTSKPSLRALFQSVLPRSSASERKDVYCCPHPRRTSPFLDYIRNPVSQGHLNYWRFEPVCLWVTAVAAIADASISIHLLQQQTRTVHSPPSARVVWNMQRGH